MGGPSPTALTRKAVGSSPTPPWEARKYESDLDGRITKVLDGTGATELTKDATDYTGGRVTSQTTSSGATLTFAYDQTNRQTTVLNPATNESTLTGRTPKAPPAGNRRHRPLRQTRRLRLRHQRQPQLQ